MSEATYKIISFKGSELPVQYTGFVIGKFLTSLRNGCKYFRTIDPDKYFPIYRIYVSNLLHRPTAIVRIAVLTDDEDVCLGWAITEGKKLHFIHVNSETRNCGIAKALIEEPFEEFTHITDMARNIWKTKFPNAKFNPF